MFVSILSFGIYYYNQSSTKPKAKLAPVIKNENEVVIVKPLIDEDEVVIVKPLINEDEVVNAKHLIEQPVVKPLIEPTLIKDNDDSASTLSDVNIDKTETSSIRGECSCCHCSNDLSSCPDESSSDDESSSCSDECCRPNRWTMPGNLTLPSNSTSLNHSVIVNNEGFGEVNFRPPPTNTLTTNSNTIPYTIKNQIKLNCFSSTITFNYSNNNQHDAIYILNNIDSMWSNVTAGLAMIEINGQQKILSYNTKYNKDTKVLTLYINDIDEQVYKLSANNIKITILLADCINPLTNLNNPGCNLPFPPGGHCMSR